MLDYKLLVCVWLSDFAGLEFVGHGRDAVPAAQVKCATEFGCLDQGGDEVSLRQMADSPSVGGVGDKSHVLICTSALDMCRFIGRYLRIMQAMPSLATDGLRALRSICEVRAPC